MFARFFYSSHGLWIRVRAGALAIVLANASQAMAAPACKPVLAVTEVRFSEIHLETMLRKWTATVSVDSSRCATQSGRFEILFTRLKENGPEIDFIEPFVWKPGIVDVSVDFWADEAVEGYRLGGIATCPCRD
jgi:hypothetical protein